MLLLVVNDWRAFAFPLDRRNTLLCGGKHGTTTSAPGERSSELLLIYYVSHAEPWNFRSITAAPKTPNTVLHHGTPPRTHLKAREKYSFGLRNRCIAAPNGTDLPRLDEIARSIWTTEERMDISSALGEPRTWRRRTTADHETDGSSAFGNGVANQGERAAGGGT